jgi:predicted ester cyclase
MTAMSSSEAEALVLGFFEHALNAHDLDAFDRYCDIAYLWHGSSDPDLGPEISGLEPFKNAVGLFFEGFADLKITVLDMAIGADRVAVRFYETGTHTGPFLGVAPTGRRARWDTQAFYRAAGGLLVEEWSVGDNLSLMKQIGAI